MISNVCENICSNVAVTLAALSQTRWALKFDGIGIRGALASRAINPDGNIFVRWRQLGVNNSSGTPRTIVTQCVSAVVAEREFMLRWQGNGGNLSCILGGVEVCPTGLLPQDGTWSISIVGNSVVVTLDGVVVGTRTQARGAAREPSAFTLFGARNSAGTFPEVMLGYLYDITINNTYWPLNEKDYNIQLPVPSGLGAELITAEVLVNPAIKGSQWTYLGDGRWQYVGDGSLNELIFIDANLQPTAGFLEFEIESISGQLVCTFGGGASINPSLFSATGLKRYFYLTAGGSNNNRINFKRNFSGSGVVTSCIIKNISFKPLGTCNPMTIQNATSANWVEVPA